MMGLHYRPFGPDKDGNYHVAYPTPGAEHVLTLAGQSRSKALVEQECARLNATCAEPRRIACDLERAE